MGDSLWDAETLPVIAAIGEIIDRPTDPRQAIEPIRLMAEAGRIADEDGGGGWLAGVDSLDVVHQRTWNYENTARQVSAALGIAPTRAVYGPYGGESPIRFLHNAARRIVDGTSRIGLIVSGEAQYARSKAMKEGWTPDWTPIADSEENALNFAEMIDPLAMAQGVLTPTQVYPFFESAWAAARGQTSSENIAGSAALWARYANRAAQNPYAWRQDAPDASAIADTSGGNRWIAWPYTRAMVANPEVNQGAALIVTSLAEARRRGIPDDRLIHIHAGAYASEPRNWLERDTYASSIAQQTVLRAIAAKAGADFDLFELYSCFPIVPKMAGDVLGDSALQKPSVTGGLSFFGAPLNSFMTHATTAMVRALRAEEGSLGLLYGQGEYVTKHHALAVGREPRPGELQDGDVNARADADRGDVPPLTRDAQGPAAVEAYTVMFDRHGQPTFAAVVARGDAGWRTLARSDDELIVTQFLDGNAVPVGRAGTVGLDAQGRPEWSFL